MTIRVFCFSLVDYFNLMIFDYYSLPMNRSGIFDHMTTGRDTKMEIAHLTIRHLIDRENVSKDKLVLGLAAYTRGWTAPKKILSNKTRWSEIKLSPKQNFTMIDGAAAHFEMCTMREEDNFRKVKNGNHSYVYKMDKNDVFVWFSIDMYSEADAKVSPTSEKSFWKQVSPIFSLAGICDQKRVGRRLRLDIGHGRLPRALQIEQWEISYSQSCPRSVSSGDLSGMA
jgi:hypothetical protein